MTKKYKWTIFKKRIESKIKSMKNSHYSLSAKLSKEIQFFFIKLFHPNIPRLTGIELSNYCNLKCENCPTPITKIPRGFASDKHIELALKYVYPNDCFSFHRHGEPFLHKNFLKYLKKATKMGLRTVVSTNGLLLNKENIKALAEIMPYCVIVSLHTKQSVKAFIELTKYMLSKNKMFFSYCAHKLSHNAEEVDIWLEELNASDNVKKYIYLTPSHSWAGNIESRKVEYEKNIVNDKIQNCWFIKNDFVSLRWDGTVVACCLDSENDTIIGHLDNFYDVRHNKNGHKLCMNCDPSWVNENV